MKATYDPDVDAMYVQLNDTKKVFETFHEGDILVDYAENGDIIGVEVLRVTKQPASSIECHRQMQKT